MYEYLKIRIIKCKVLKTITAIFYETGTWRVHSFQALQQGPQQRAAHMHWAAVGARRLRRRSHQGKGRTSCYN